MLIQTHSLRRRSRRERQVLAHLRGDIQKARLEDSDSAEAAYPLSRSDQQAIMNLRKSARNLGLQIGKTSHAFVHWDELILLLWIAKYQRQSPEPLPIPDKAFLETLRRCSLVFDKIGLRLPLNASATKANAAYHALYQGSLASRDGGCGY